MSVLFQAPPRYSKEQLKSLPVTVKIQSYPNVRIMQPTLRVETSTEDPLIRRPTSSSADIQLPSSTLIAITHSTSSTVYLNSHQSDLKRTKTLPIGSPTISNGLDLADLPQDFHLPPSYLHHISEPGHVSSANTSIIPSSSNCNQTNKSSHPHNSSAQPSSIQHASSSNSSPALNLNHIDRYHNGATDQVGQYQTDSQDVWASTALQSAKNRRRPATYRNAEPSNFCHICGKRPRPSRDFLVCANHLVRTCRKIFCQDCFISIETTDFSTAKKEALWKCTHCQGVCPNRSSCKTYERSNDNRRKSMKLNKKSKKNQNIVWPNPEATLQNQLIDLFVENKDATRDLMKPVQLILKRNGLRIVEIDRANMSKSKLCTIDSVGIEPRSNGTEEPKETSNAKLLTKHMKKT